MMGIALLGLLVLIIGAIAVLAFEIWMFVHAIQNPHINTERRVLWCVGMVLLHPFVAIAYLLTDYKLA